MFSLIHVLKRACHNKEEITILKKHYEVLITLNRINQHNFVDGFTFLKGTELSVDNTSVILYFKYFVFTTRKLKQIKIDITLYSINNIIKKP